MYHIKRDGQLFCNPSKLSLKFDRSTSNTISFTDAHKRQDLNTRCCERCLEVYYEKLSNLKEPIVTSL